MSTEKTVSFPVRIPVELEEQIEAVHKKTGLSKQDIMRLCMRIGLVDLAAAEHDLPGIVKRIADDKGISFQAFAKHASENEQTFSSLIPAATATTDPCADPAASPSRIPLTSRQQTKRANIVPLPPQHVVAHHGLNEPPGASTPLDTTPQPVHYEPAKKHRRKS